MRLSRRQLSPAQLLALSLVGLIGVGTGLLLLPFASARDPLTILQALFTATSAVCVTGLVALDTGSQLSLFGQLVVLVLIQAGGLGYMSITTVVAAAIGRQLSVQERLTLQEALSVQTMEGLIRFVFTVFKLTLTFELVGAALLTIAWTGEMGLLRAAYFGVFHSVSAFNNAGFSLFSDNLIRYRGDWLVNLVVSTLVICGGLGFVVLTELGRRRSGVRLSVHTRLVLTMSALLIALGTMAVFVLERVNPRTLGPLAIDEAVLAAFFQAVTPRTAGFNTLNIADLTEPTLFVIMILMFIGAAPGGTGGGVKVTTFGITVAALWATVRGMAEPVLFRRRLSPTLVARAFFISLIAFLALNVVAALLLITEDRDLLPTLFETISAFGTVGLSTGEADSPLSLSGHFTSVGQLLVAASMFMGRIGPLTLAVALARRRASPPIRYPEGRILVG
ncbi:MAG TPA: TrkH family potassium uptake protein [Vicinamibacterales bacterium]|nr:TrkH family potassium uptake protein [Vicinamibacterales bacterium]